MAVAVAELWTVTSDTAVQAPQNHLRLIHGSAILDHTGTRFLGGRLKRRNDLYASIYGMQTSGEKRHNIKDFVFLATY